MGYRGTGLSMEPLYVMLSIRNVTQIISFNIIFICMFNMGLLSADVVPLSVCFGAAGVLRRVVGRWRNGRDKLLKVHDVGQEGVLRSGAFWVD